MEILKKINPTRQPVAYVFLAVVLYQLFIKGDSIPDAWVQYLVEFIGAGVTWGSVTPTSKLKDADASTNV